MKKHLCHSIILCGLTIVPALSQSPEPGVAPASAAIPARAIKSPESGSSASEAPKLTKFNLDFPGGNPKQLVAAIEKATGRPLNVVIPDEYANESISALRMTQVTAPDLFRAMESASIKTEPYQTGGFGGGVALGGWGLSNNFEHQSVSKPAGRNLMIPFGISVAGKKCRISQHGTPSQPRRK